MKIDLSNYEQGNPRKNVLSCCLRDSEYELACDLVHVLELRNMSDLVRYCINSTIENDPTVIEKFCELEGREDINPYLALALNEYYEMLDEEEETVDAE